MLDFLTCRLDRHRNFGIPNQFPTKSRGEIIQNIEKYNNQKDCFISLCEYDNYGNIFPLFFLCDLDSHDENQDLVNSDTAKILNWCEKNNITYICDESGHKGIHVLMELNQKHKYYNNHFRAFYYYLLNELDLKTIDSCCCETRRLCRVSETIHPISGKLCCTLLKKEANPLNLFDYIENIEYKNNDSEYECKGYTCSIGESKFIFPFNTDFKMPCIFKAINKADVNHVIRWFWVKILQRKGYSSKEIYDEAKGMGWDDFDEGKTSYQIEYTMQNSYTLRCRKKIDENDKYGICVDVCPFRKKIEELNVLL